MSTIGTYIVVGFVLFFILVLSLFLEKTHGNYRLPILLLLLFILSCFLIKANEMRKNGK